MVKSRHLFALESDSLPPAQSSITFDPSSVLPAPGGRVLIFPITERHHTAHYIDIAFYRGYGAR